MVRNGVLWVESDAALGAAGGGVTLSRGTLRSSQTFATSRPVTLDGTGTISVDPSQTLTLNGAVSGGNLVKADSGTLVLNGASPIPTAAPSSTAERWSATLFRSEAIFA